MAKRMVIKANKKKEKSGPKGPQSADEYLVAGVDFEEAGEKWRAGDAAKSSRFFIKAWETYTAGLQEFPTSFDLAYNKARVQYDLSQQPRLLQHVPFSHVELLHTALESHRHALDLKRDDADTLLYALEKHMSSLLIVSSNTAQVLTSLAENLGDLRVAHNSNRPEALALFEEALELFQRCLGIQELAFAKQENSTEGQAEAELEAEAELAQVTATYTNTTPVSPDEDERWTSIIEPITQSTLLDTLIAQIETLTNICGLVVSQGAFQSKWIEDYASTVLDKTNAYSQRQPRAEEISLVKANLRCALADAQFRSGQLELLSYEHMVETAFDIGSMPSPRALCDRADSSLTLNASICAVVQISSLNEDEGSRLNELRWKHITRALGDLTAAARLPDAENVPKIHIRRGDCEMLRYRLGEAPTSYGPSRKNAAVLLKNAETYYRGASKAANVQGSNEEEEESRVKEAVVNSIGGNRSMLVDLVDKDRKTVDLVLEEMMDDNLISRIEMIQI